MNATPTQPFEDERAELARLLPAPVERDVPSDRHHRVQEFVMSQIHQDLRTAGSAPRRAPSRRLAWLASAAAAAVAVLIGVTAVGGPRDGDVPPAATGPSGPQILLAAATVAERTPQGSGDYWYQKVVSNNSKDGTAEQYEYWTRRDGQTWFRGAKTGGDLVKWPDPLPFSLAGSEVSVDQLAKLPTEPDALKAWISDAVRNSGARTSGGPLTADQQRRLAFEGLISLVSHLPAPPRVRAAAFRAVASYPNVRSLGAVEGGQGLEITLPDWAPARLVVDPANSQIRKANGYISAQGTIVSFSDDRVALSFYTLVAGWTDRLPE